jgi:hypothetical protein
MAEETAYQVLLVHRDDNVIDGFHVYRSTQLPQADQIITVETALSLSPGPVQSHAARVTRVVPDDKFPIRAVEL